MTLTATEYKYVQLDEHNRITLGLRLREVDVLTVQEDGRSGVSNSILLDRATALQRLMFSQDQDFLVEAKRRQVEE